MAFFNPRPRRKIAMPEVTLVPLIDTALTLLIIFIITAPMMRTSIKVDLPDSKTSQTTKVEEQTISVEIDAQGLVHVDGVVFNVAKSNKARSQAIRDLQQQIVRRVTTRNNTVFLYADKTLKYNKIVKVFDILNAIEGVAHVALVTHKIQ